MLVDGISGTLGRGVCLIALGLGVNCILGTGRNPDLLADVKVKIPFPTAPRRCHEHSHASSA